MKMVAPKSPLPTIDKHTLHTLLLEYAQRGDVQVTAKGFRICCPFHDDRNPSCNVFFNSGSFFCFVCHGDQPKGKRGASAYTGFTKLGMPKDKARDIFLSGKTQHLSIRRIETTDKLAPLNLDSFEVVERTEMPVTYKVKEHQVAEREPWPDGWGFRGIPYSVLMSDHFVDRFDPTLVTLKNERNNRLALSIGGAEKFKNTKEPKYLKQEVFLRLSSSQRVKAVNTKGMNLDIDKLDTRSATLFGLINNRISKGSRGLFIVEGPFDALALTHLIRQKPELGVYDVVAILGTPQWDHVARQINCDILRYTNNFSYEFPIFLAFDNDDAGFKLTETAIKTLSLDSHLLRRFEYPHAIKDPGKLIETPDIFYDCFAKCISQQIEVKQC